MKKKTVSINAFITCKLIEKQMSTIKGGESTKNPKETNTPSTGTGAGGTIVGHVPKHT